MEVVKHGRSNEHEHDRGQDYTEQSASQFPLPTLPLSLTSSSICSRDSAGIASHVHPPTPNMDGSADGHRRRRALLADEDENEEWKRRRKSRSHRRRRSPGRTHQGLEAKHSPYSSNEEPSSDFSSPSTGEDVEMQHISSDDGLTDDEEAGLAKKDNRNRKRRTKNTLLDQRIIGEGKVPKLDTNSADKSVIHASLINALLIASWYLFSLSISIVSQKPISIFISFTNAVD